MKHLPRRGDGCLKLQACEVLDLRSARYLCWPAPYASTCLCLEQHPLTWIRPDHTPAVPIQISHNSPSSSLATCDAICLQFATCSCLPRTPPYLISNKASVGRDVDNIPLPAFHTYYRPLQGESGDVADCVNVRLAGHQMAVHLSVRA